MVMNRKTRQDLRAKLDDIITTSIIDYKKGRATNDILADLILKLDDIRVQIDTADDFDTTSYNYLLISYEDNDGIRRTYTQTCDSGKKTMYQAADMICFSDYSDEKVEAIYADGRLVHYTGWQPGMVFTFADEQGNEVYTFSAPNWEH